MEKICTMCNKAKTLDNFTTNNFHSDGLQSYCKECYNEYQKSYYHGVNGYNKKYFRNLRLKAIEYYSNGKMQCRECGINIIDVLDINHINGNGKKHRKELGNHGSGHFFRWLKNNNYPNGFNVMCANCNWKKYVNENVESVNLSYHAINIFKKKTRVFQVYSNGYMHCKLCKEDDIDILTIEHINGGGCKHTRNITTDLYTWLESNKYPSGFGVLCRNCQRLERFRREKNVN